MPLRKPGKTRMLQLAAVTAVALAAIALAPTMSTAQAGGNRVAPAGRADDSTPAEIWHSGLSGPSLQLRPLPVGSVSDSVTLRAMPGPLFVTVIVNPMSSPAETVPSSALLSIATVITVKPSPRSSS